MGHSMVLFIPHWRLHGGMAWSSWSELLLAIGRGGHHRADLTGAGIQIHLLWPHGMSCAQYLSQCLEPECPHIPVTSPGGH